MSIYFGGRIEIVEGDITELVVEAIVNAAHKSLPAIEKVIFCTFGRNDRRVCVDAAAGCLAV